MKYFSVVLLFGSLSISNVKAQKAGCPDPAALNYDSSVTVNNGSCNYKNISLSPKHKFALNPILSETSGLILWNNKIWTHNDSGGDPFLYAMQPTSNAIVKTVKITNATNQDWEDIAQDSKYIYIGDFGNNGRSNRTDLKVYKVKKADILAGNSVTASVINFSYNDQTEVVAGQTRFDNFDCEAMIAYGDSLYLFSKNWGDYKTRLYKLPKKPGTYKAINIGELNVHGLITGATVTADKKTIALSGYNTLINPFVYLLYGFKGTDFFGGNKRKVLLSENFTQMEGICAAGSTSFYVSNEKFAHSLVTTPAKIREINLDSLLNPYYAAKANPAFKTHKPVAAKP